MRRLSTVSHKRAPCHASSRSAYLAAVVVAALAIFLPSLLLAETVSFALLYPQTEGTTRDVFDEARMAVARQVTAQGDHLVELSLNRATDNRVTVQNWLTQVKPDLVFALGRTSLESLAGIEARYRIVAAMVDVSVQDKPPLSAVTILPEPRSILSTLRLLRPNVRRVFVAYNPRKHAWLIERAVKQARDLGLTLAPLRSDTLVEASVHFTGVFRYSNPETDALWLIDTQYVTEDTTLRFIVQESWLANFAVCSNAVQHLTQGVLCTTFVRPALAAETMLQLAEERLAGKPPRIVMLSDVSRGVNARVGSHLGIRFNSSQRQLFEVIVGE